MNGLRIEYNISINNVDYIVFLSFNDQTLDLVMETEKETHYWKGSFEAKYIEDMTQKAGSLKSFQIFLKILQSALTNDSNTVKLDILSFNDLEQMRNKQLNSTNNLSNNSNDILKQNKKYLIIAFTNEFEKVNFPLPLNYVIEPDLEMMRKTIERLKKPRKSVRTPLVYSNMSDIDELKRENFNLLNKIKFLELSQRNTPSLPETELESDMKNTQQEFEAYALEVEKKKRLLMETIEELKAKLNNDKKAASNFVTSLPLNKEKSAERINELEEQIILLNNILMQERKKFEKKLINLNGKGENIESEILYLRENETKMRIKINQLQREIDDVGKKCKEASFKGKNNNFLSTPKSNYSFKSSGSKKSIHSVNSRGSEISKNTKTSINTQNLVERLKPKSNNKYNSYNYLNNKYNTNKTIQPSLKSPGKYNNIVKPKPNGSKPNDFPKKNNYTSNKNTFNYNNKPKSIASTNISLKNNNKKQLNSGDISDKLNKIQNLLNNAKI